MAHGLAAPERVIGRYALFDPIAQGGMATVHLGRMVGPGGFHRVVAIKRMLPQFARDRDFARMFLEEARLTTRVRHPNVVSATDVVAEEGELFLVMDYVEGESLGNLIRLGGTDARGAPVPVPIAVAIVVQALHGLHAAHEAKSETGAPLGLVHRDVSPQNILVGTDGLARVVDFGIAKAAGGEQTRSGVLKGKAPYMAPEQIRAEKLDRRVDVHAASVVLWEALTGRRLFVGETSYRVFDKVLAVDARPLVSSKNAEVPRTLDAVVAKGLSLSPDDRYPTALAMAEALEEASSPASPLVVSRWVSSIAEDGLRERARRVARCEGASGAAESLPVASTPAPEPPATGEATEPDVSAPLLAPIPVSLDDAPAPIEETKPVIRAPAPPPPASLAAPPAAGPGHVPASRDEPIAIETIPANDEPSREPAPKSLSRGALVAVALGAAVLAFVLGGAVLSRSRPTGVTPSSAATPSSSSRDVATHPLASTLTSAVEPTSPTTREAEQVVAPESTASAEVASSAAVASSASPTSSARPALSTGKSPRAKCSPPFYYEGGLKRFKPGCI